MSLFDATIIQRFTREGEDLFNLANNCIVDRLALDIVSGTSQYTLPDYILSIRRVTWLGWKIDAMNQRELRNLNYSGAESGNRPWGYIFNNIGQLKIQFFPVPSDTIATIATNLYGSEILNRVIVEYYRTSDYATFVIPPYFSQRLLAAYKFSKLYAVEGKGQNLKTAKYFDQKWKFLKDKYSNLMSDLALTPGRTINGPSTFDDRVLYPQLPISTFGIGVNEGE